MSDGSIGHIWLKLHRIEDQLKSEATWEAHQLYRALYGYRSRVDRLQAAFRDSGPMASHMIAVKLEGLDLTMIWRILMSALHDIALYYCSAVVLGTAMGAGAGAMAGGVGAVPGAGIGMAAGMQLGTWVMTFLGLKMLAEGLAEIIPPAFHWYADGFRAVWGPTTQSRFDARYPKSAAGSEMTAAHCFAQGHVLMIVAMLQALVAYLTRGESEEVLLQAIRSSQRLGPKMADWLVKNKDILKKHPALQPKVRQSVVPKEVPDVDGRPHPPLRTRQRLTGKGVSEGVVQKAEATPTNAVGSIAAGSARGLSKNGGIFSSSTNEAGGTIWTSEGPISQNDFGHIVNSELMQGRDVHIITGVHGNVDGTIATIDSEMYQFDVDTFGEIPGVTVHNFPDLSHSQLNELLNGTDTVIGGFCSSEACLASYK